MKKNCVFCRELSGSRDTNFAKLYPELKGRVIAETNDLVVFPCIGQLAPGHSLVVTKKHYSNFAEAFEARPELKDQLLSIIDVAHVYIDIEKERTLYFEHGVVTDQDGGCGIYHAHLHLVPLAGGIDIGAIGAESPIHTSNLIDAYAMLYGSQPYAMIGGDLLGYATERLAVALPSQTIRKKVASALNCLSWDWRSAGQEQEMIEILSRKRA